MISKSNNKEKSNTKTMSTKQAKKYSIPNDEIPHGEQDAMEEECAQRAKDGSWDNLCPWGCLTHRLHGELWCQSCTDEWDAYEQFDLKCPICLSYGHCRCTSGEAVNEYMSSDYF